MRGLEQNRVAFFDEFENFLRGLFVAADKINVRQAGVACTFGDKLAEFAQSNQRVEIVLDKLCANFAVKFFRDGSEFQHVAQDSELAPVVNFGRRAKSHAH